MSLQVADTFKGCVAQVEALNEALGPPMTQRAKGQFEVEVEAAGEGTFTLRYDDGVLTGKKGFAKGDPLLSAAIPKGGWPFLQRLLQAAVDGFPNAPQLARRQAIGRELPAADLQALLDGVSKLRDVRFDITLSGAGPKGKATYAIARGLLDEATREVKVQLNAERIERVLDGGSVEALRAAKVSMPTGLATELVSALGAVWTKMRE